MKKLKTRVLKARAALLEIEPEYEEVKNRYDKALKEWKEASSLLEDADYQQALIDGRMKKVQFGQRAPKPLTLEQIKSIAKKLGVSLDSVEEDKDEKGN